MTTAELATKSPASPIWGIMDSRYVHLLRDLRWFFHSFHNVQATASTALVVVNRVKSRVLPARSNGFNDCEWLFAADSGSLISASVRSCLISFGFDSGRRLLFRSGKQNQLVQRMDKKRMDWTDL